MRRYDTPSRSRSFTDKVYSGASPEPDKLKKEVFVTERQFYPEKPKYNIYFGEITREELEGFLSRDDALIVPNISEIHITNVMHNVRAASGRMPFHEEQKWDVLPVRMTIRAKTDFSAMNTRVLKNIPT